MSQAENEEMWARESRSESRERERDSRHGRVFFAIEDEDYGNESQRTTGSERERARASASDIQAS